MHLDHVDDILVLCHANHFYHDVCESVHFWQSYFQLHHIPYNITFTVHDYIRFGKWFQMHQLPYDKTLTVHDYIDYVNRIMDILERLNQYRMYFELDGVLYHIEKQPNGSYFFNKPFEQGGLEKNETQIKQILFYVLKDNLNYSFVV